MTLRHDPLETGKHGLNRLGLTYGNPDFVKYVESYGGIGHRVKNSAELEPLLEKCLNTDGFHLIDCPVDYSENDQILNNDIKELSRKV